MAQFPFVPGSVPNPYTYYPCHPGAPQPFAAPGYTVPFQEPPTTLFAPPNHGNVKYNYRIIGNPNGGPPCQGKVPGLDSNPFATAAPSPMPMGMPMFQSAMPMSTGMCPPPLPPFPMPSVSAPCEQGQEYEHGFDNADFIVRYFEENPIIKYNSGKSDIFHIPSDASWRQKAFRRDMTVADMIMHIGCWARANHHRNYPKSHVGIQQLLPSGPNNFKLGTSIMYGEERAQWSIDRLWEKDTKEIWVARLPVFATEISTSADLIRSVWPANTDLRFKVITLDEPLKRELLPYLEAEHTGKPLPHIARKAFVAYYIRNTDRFHEAIVNLTTRTIESNVRLGPNVHGNGDYEEVLKVETIALEDPGVKAEIAKLQLPEGTVVCADPWIYGSDGVNDDDRLWQVFMYMRDPANPNEADSNHYAFPLPISPVIDSSTFKLVRIDIMPTGADNTVRPLKPYTPKPANEYLSDYQKLRTDLKPLQVVQPEGASFTITSAGETGQVIDWQKWSFRFGYNQREGMVLYDVRYDSRPLFYRLSLSDMNIPYADPRHPFHKKAAFDLGDAGAGAMANNLKLGCDCLGNIQYLSAVITDDKGQPEQLENCVCVHEQDAGIGWKHTNYRTGRASLVRSRELVLQSIITVSNYEYILAFMFNQAGELHYEVRATGILSTQPIDHELDHIGVPFGTVVHPGVMAAHHQHIFSLRIDPMIDGPTNNLIYDEAYTMPLDKEMNPHGTGYYTQTHPVTHSGGFDLNSDANRVFKITNPNSLNPVNAKPVGYKIVAPPFQKMLAHPSSYHFRRAEFADHNIYVTKHDERELYAGGWYTNQSRGGTGVRSWADRKDPLLPATTTEEHPDIVLWVQFGMNHIPRVEDFPVMPCEILRVSLKPVNFFDKNPALDVPPSEQWFNRSTLVTEMHRQPAAETTVTNGGTNGATNGHTNGSCCSGTNGANGH